MKLANLNSNTWTYILSGSKNKKTGKSKDYTVTVTDDTIVNCSCPAREFRRYSPCKHMKQLKEYTPHLKI